MHILQTATVMFAIAALGGLLMAIIRFSTKRNPPAWLAMLHGLLAASGLTLLAYAICTTPVPQMAVLALALFLLAATGGAVLSLAYKWRQRLLPAWLVVVILARETAVTLIRGFALAEGIVMHAETLGKYKFILQALAIVALLVHYRYWGLDFFAVGLYFLALSAVVAIWSGVNYHAQFFRLRHS